MTIYGQVVVSNTCVMIQLFCHFGTKAQMVAGSAAIDWAKMIGRTPLMFTFIGRCVLWPPYILRPTTRLEYCTGRRRSASLTSTMSTMSSRAPRYISTKTHQARSPLATLLIWRMMEFGKRATMLTNRMIEMPLPMPNSVICSPSHMMRAEPDVKVRMMTMAAQTLWAKSALMRL